MVDVDVTTFTQAWGMEFGQRIDFVSIDVEGQGWLRALGVAVVSIAMEGAEMAILRSIDFSSVDIGALAVENNEKSPELCAFLSEKGYDCLGELHLLDELFVKRR